MPTPMPNTPSDIQSEDTWVPEGYVLTIGPNNQKYIVPEYCLPDLDQIYLSDKKKEELNASNAEGTVSFFITLLF